MIQELVIPLVHEVEFYNMLTTALESVTLHLTAVQSDFLSSLRDLSNIISDSAHPASSASKFRPHSALTAHAGSVRVKISKVEVTFSLPHSSEVKFNCYIVLQSDLYAWREIFQLYIETEVFESFGERTRGERNVEESEKRLHLFVERLAQHGLGDGSNFKMEKSPKALTTFLSLNLFILNVKKVRLLFIYKSAFWSIDFVSINSFHSEMQKLLVKFSRNMPNERLFLYCCLLLPLRYPVSLRLRLCSPTQRPFPSRKRSYKLLEKH